MSDSRWGRVLVRDVKPSLLGRLVAGDSMRQSQAAIGGVWVGGKISLTEQGVKYAPAWWEQFFHIGLKEIGVGFAEIKNIRVADEENVVGTVILGLMDEDFVFQCYRANGMAGAIVEAAKCSHAS